MAKDTPPLATSATTATPPAYPEAVKIARNYFEHYILEGATGRNLLDPEDWRQLDSEAVGAAMLAQRPAYLVGWASLDCEGWDALRLGVASAIDRGDEIPPEALQWLAWHLRGEIERPKASAGRHDARGLHIAIVFAVSYLVDCGMRATRNDASPAVSACDAVADALAQLKLSPTTFYAVKKIWLARRKPGFLTS